MTNLHNQPLLEDKYGYMQIMFEVLYQCACDSDCQMGESVLS